MINLISLVESYHGTDIKTKALYKKARNFRRERGLRYPEAENREVFHMEDIGFFFNWVVIYWKWDQEEGSVFVLYTRGLIYYKNNK